MTMYDSFNAFMKEGFETACISSTKASWGGSGYSVELTDDGYRVIWDGSCYDSEAMVIGVPPVAADDYDDDSPELSFFDNSAHKIREAWHEKVSYFESERAILANQQ